MSAPTLPAHCAKFTDALLPQARHLLACVAGLPAGAHVLDPFAGTGKGVDYMAEVAGFDAWGIELEPEFIGSTRVVQGNALDILTAYPKRRRGRKIDAIFTSPTYGSRMADKDMRPSVAGTYMKSLGRAASEGSSCHMQWGDKYRSFHQIAYSHWMLVEPKWFLLNVKDHYRGKQIQRVSDWHVETLVGLGFTVVEQVTVDTPSLRVGANADLRVEFEWLHLLKGPSA